ncbi:MAG: hypothetical protein ACR2H1_04090, partial [Limisphaerales bacterium]
FLIGFIFFSVATFGATEFVFNAVGLAEIAAKMTGEGMLFEEFHFKKRRLPSAMRTASAPKIFRYFILIFLN